MCDTGALNAIQEWRVDGSGRYCNQLFIMCLKIIRLADFVLLWSAYHDHIGVVNLEFFGVWSEELFFLNVFIQVYVESINAK